MFHGPLCQDSDQDVQRPSKESVWAPESTTIPKLLVGARNSLLAPVMPPRPPWLSSLNTEHTEHLSDLCVEARPGTEDTEALLTRGEIFASRNEIRDL